MDHQPQTNLEDLQILSFLPVWIYYSIRRRAGLTDSNPLELIRQLENHLSVPEDPSAYVIDFLKINLHKLFAQYFGSAKEPDFSPLDTQLQQGLDLLLLHAVADPRIEALRQQQILFCDHVTRTPVSPQDSPLALPLMQARAQSIQKLLQ